jgi:hypothetical protein
LWPARTSITCNTRSRSGRAKTTCKPRNTGNVVGVQRIAKCRLRLRSIRKQGFDFRLGAWAHHARLLDAAVEEHERRPELYPERTTQRLTAAVFDADVPNTWMRTKRGRDVRLSSLAMRAPRRAELEQRQAGKRVHLLPGGLRDSMHSMSSVGAVHARRVPTPASRRRGRGRAADDQTIGVGAVGRFE